ncbi:MAG: hypothetical protein ACLFUY_04175, partial [Desulfobacterales bacterium]
PFFFENTLHKTTKITKDTKKFILLILRNNTDIGKRYIRSAAISGESLSGCCYAGSGLSASGSGSVSTSIQIPIPIKPRKNRKRNFIYAVSRGLKNSPGIAVHSGAPACSPFSRADTQVRPYNRRFLTT